MTNVWNIYLHFVYIYMVMPHAIHGCYGNVMAIVLCNAYISDISISRHRRPHFRDRLAKQYVVYTEIYLGKL